MSTELDDLRKEFRTLTVRQLAEAMGIEQWRIYEMVKKGEAPPHFRVGKTLRFPLTGYRKWFAKKSGEG